MSYPRPLGNRVLVRQDQPSDKIGSFFVPDSAMKEWPQTATVLRLGPQVSDDCPRPNSRVIFRRRPGSALNPDDREPGLPTEFDDLLMLQEDDILAEVTDE